MKKVATALTVLALGTPSGALSQGAPTQEPARRVVFDERIQDRVVTRQEIPGEPRIFAGAVESKTTTGRPYSAEAVNETVQVLGDGNRIHRSSVTRVYRDSEGRTRREMYTPDGKLRTIAISDPVSHVNITLDPEKKIAFRTGGNIVFPSVVPGSGNIVARGQGGSATPPAAPVIAQGRGGGRGGAGGAISRTPASDDPNVRTEDLGSQNIEGVLGNGTRTTTVIPAGQIGNANEIRVVSERWFSEELQVLVLTKHSDPRSGETTYRLRNILRAEPDPSLFTIPADYTVQTRNVRSPQ